MTEEIEEVYSLLIPLVEQRLLVPRSNVVEVSGDKGLTEYSNAVPWLLGSLEWEGTLVPVVSFEGLCDEQIPDIAGRSRIVLMRCLTSALSSRAFGIVSQGFPKLVRVGHNAISRDDATFNPEVPVLCRVNMANQQPLIPDLEQLEQRIATALTESV